MPRRKNKRPLGDPFQVKLYREVEQRVEEMAMREDREVSYILRRLMDVGLKHDKGPVILERARPRTWGKRPIMVRLFKDFQERVLEIALREEREVSYILRRLVEIGLEHDTGAPGLRSAPPPPRGEGRRSHAVA